MNIKHIFFDLDHTLWDFEANSARAFSHIFSQSNVEINLNEFLEVYKPINFKYWKLYREEKVSKPKLRYKRLKESFDKLSYSASDDLINHLSKVYIDNLANYNQLFDGAIPILNYLQMKYELHIITNGFDEVQSLKLERSGIMPYFNLVITSESVGVKKPNPKIFDFALQSANTLPEHSIMIGDNLEADVQGALDMNMNAIFCNFEKEPVNENIISIHHLSELKQHL
jgi:putative hydrolase of the HAD superfamily